MRVSKTLTAAALTLGLVAGGGAIAATTAPPAEAQTGPFGGRVTLLNGSTGNLKVSGGLKKVGSKYVMLSPIGWIAPGQNSRAHAHIFDTDAFQAPYGCKTRATIGGRWVNIPAGKVEKINDTKFYMTVSLKC